MAVRFVYTYIRSLAETAELIKVFYFHHPLDSFHTSPKDDNEEEFKFHYRSSKESLALACEIFNNWKLI